MSKNSADPFLKIREKQKKARLPLSGEQKIELLHKLDRGVSVMRLTVEYGVGTTTIYDLKRQRDKLLELYTGINDREVSKLKKKTQKAKNEDLDRMLVEWVKQELKRNCGLPLSSSVVIKQAFKYHEELNIEGEGEYTERWLQKFEKRHNINYLNSYDRTTSSWNKTIRTYNNGDKLMSEYVVSQRSKDKLVFKEFIYTEDRTRGMRTYWKCHLRAICNGRAVSVVSDGKINTRMTKEHTHPPSYQGGGCGGGGTSAKTNLQNETVILIFIVVILSHFGQLILWPSSYPDMVNHLKKTKG